MISLLLSSYVDPEAVIGCEDGKVRVFDLYSRNCSQIVKYDSVSLLALHALCSLRKRFK